MDPAQIISAAGSGLLASAGLVLLVGALGAYRRQRREAMPTTVTGRAHAAVESDTAQAFGVVTSPGEEELSELEKLTRRVAELERDREDLRDRLARQAADSAARDQELGERVETLGGRLDRAVMDLRRFVVNTVAGNVPAAVVVALATLLGTAFTEWPVAIADAAYVPALCVALELAVGGAAVVVWAPLERWYDRALDRPAEGP